MKVPIRSLWLMLGVTVIMAGGACGDSPPETAAADYVGVTTPAHGTFVGVPLPDGTGWLEGPHFSIEIRWVAVVTQLDRQLTRLLALDSSLRAAEGQELVLAQVDSSSSSQELPRWDPEGSQVTYAVVAGGDERPLEDLPESYETIVVHVTRNDPVFLRVTDEGREMNMNLRDGSVAPESVYHVTRSEPLGAGAQEPRSSAPRERSGRRR